MLRRLFAVAFTAAACAGLWWQLGIATRPRAPRLVRLTTVCPPLLVTPTATTTTTTTTPGAPTTAPCAPAP